MVSHIIVLILLVLVVLSHSKMMQFKSISGVNINSNIVRFSNTNIPMTISTIEPFRRSSSNNNFSIKYNVKDARTAIGYCFVPPPMTTYMTPEYSSTSSNSYISFGGAGYIYPIKGRAKNGYSNGDTVTSSINWDNNTITFYVNNVLVYTSNISSTIDIAYPAISVDNGGVVDVTVSFNVK